jgi:thioredoxin-related protein
MKRFMLLLFILLTYLHANSDKISWYHNYDEGVAAAKLQHKKLFVLITSETCRWCRKLEATTMEDPGIIKRINEKYISIALIRDKDRYPKKLQAKMVPMSYYLKTDGSIINSVPGYWNIEDYHTILNDVTYNLKKEDLKRTK